MGNDKNVLNTFYIMPGFLFEGELEKLSNDARVLYSRLHNYHNKSEQNISKGFNEKGELYFILPRGMMSDMFKMPQRVISKAMDELKEHNLIDEQYDDQGMPQIFLLKEFLFSE